jgi:hypothetical protein
MSKPYTEAAYDDVSERGDDLFARKSRRRP